MNISNQPVYYVYGLYVAVICIMNIVYVYRMSILTFKRLGQLWYGKISCEAVSVAPCVPKPTSWSESLVKYYIPFIHH